MQYETSQIYVVDVATGAIRELVTKAGDWGRPVGLARRPHGRVHRPRADRPLAHGQRSVRDPADRRRPATCARSAATSTAIRSTCAGRPTAAALYFDADDRGARNIQFASIVGGVKPLTSGRHMLTFDSVSKDGVAAGIAVRSRSPAGRRQVQRAAAGPGDEAHRRQRRRAAGQAAREDRGDHLHVDAATRR